MSGAEALEKIMAIQVDLVLMDIVIKGPLDGIETAIRLRSRFDIPVIFLTAFSDEETLRRAEPAEPYGYLVKPIQRQALLSGIHMALSKHKLEHARKTIPSSPPPTNHYSTLAGKMRVAARNLAHAHELTATERTIFDLLVSGIQTPDIACMQKRSVNTINFHLRGIYRKMNVKGKSDLLRLFFQHDPS